jgi:hypothetical protein
MAGRFFRRCGWAGVVGVALAVTAAGAEQARVTVEMSVVARPLRFFGPCPFPIEFIASLTVSDPIELRYRWERSDDVATAEQSMFVRAEGPKLATVWYAGTKGEKQEVSVRLHVLHPVDVLSEPGVATLTCQ